MGITVQKKRKIAIDKINGILKNRNNILIIHYSCEGFYESQNGKSARITSIAVKNFETGKVTSFSIDKVAETQKIKFSEIENFYDNLEKEMLKLFICFLKEHKNFYWIHWNMRDINFGFEAINHRCKILDVEIEEINDDKKLNLAKALTDIYGAKYIDHPRFENLRKYNNITGKSYLMGDGELEAFKNKKFKKLNLSTHRKVEILSAIFDKLSSKKLKHKANILDIYGASPQGFLDFVKENPVGFIIWNIVLLILGAFLGKII